MPITIYDRAGNPKAELSPNDSSVQAKEVQGDNVLTLSFTLYGHIALDVYDYADFEGERYWLTERYRPKQKSTREWAYNLKLYGIESLIKNWLVLKTVDNEQDPVFTLTAPPRDHVAMIVKCMNDACGNITDWKVGQINGTENITIDYFGKYCDEGLREIAEKVGAEFWTEGQTVNICRCEHGEPVTLGYDKGLLSIDPDTANNVKFYTRLFPKGSSRNIDPSKYGYSRLQLPGGQKYIEAYSDEYGIVDHYEESAFADIYPRRTGIVSSVRSETRKGQDGNPYDIYYFTDNSLPFNPNDYQMGRVIRVSFQEGSELAGQGEVDNGTYYFEVNYNADTLEFEIITIWPYDNGLQLPGNTLIPKPGDRYILWNLRMPDEYYALAEEELLTAVNAFNREHTLDIAVFKAPTDHVWIEENGVELTIGRRVRLESEKYFPGIGYRDSRITKITRKVNLPSRMDIEISDALSRSTMQKVSDSINDARAYIQGIAGSISLPDIIRTWDRTVPTDNNLLSALRSVREFISKTRDDRSSGQIASDKAFEVGDFLAGVSGAKLGMDAETGQSFGEMDRLFIRIKAYFETLTIINADSLAGEQKITPGGGVKCTSVEELDDVYRCYFLSEQDGEKTETKIIAGDQAISQMFNAKTGTSNKVSNHRYWRLVTAVSNDAYSDDSGNRYGYIDLSKADCENGSDIPQAGDTIVQFGNRNDRTRQAAMVFSTVDADAPSIKLLTGIDSYTIVGKDIVSYGYDAVKGNAYFNCYGDTYIGDRDGTTFIKYDRATKTLDVKARISLTSTIGGTNIKDFVNDAAQSAADKAKAELEAGIKALQNQVDGVIESFSGFGAPTLTNYPANEWGTDAERSRHDRDIYTDITPYVDDATTPTSGQSWKWYYNSPTDYGWVKIADSDAVKALRLATMSVRDTDVLYISHTSPLLQNAPALPVVNPDGIITDSKGWQTKAPDWQEGRYIWQTTYVRRGDGSAAFSDPTCIQGTKGHDGKGISSITEQYYLSTSRTQIQGGSWSDTRQPWVAGRFYWTRSKIAYSDGSVAYKGEICATGEAGADAPNLLQRFSATGGAYASEWHPSYLDGDVWMQTSADGGATWSARMPVGRGGYSANLLEGTSDEWHEFALGMYAFIYAHIPLSELGLKAGDMFTFSAGFRTGASGKGLRVGVEAYNSEADRVLVARGNTVRDGEGRAWCSGTVPAGYAELRMRLENADAAINTISTEEYRGLKLEKGNNPNPVWTPAADEMVGRDGQWQKFQWAKNNDAASAPAAGWQDTPAAALAGEYVWMRSGTVVPPATEPAKWEPAVRLTGDTGAAGGDVYRLDLDNERAAVACDAAGNVTGPYPSSVASVYKGSVKLTDGVAFSIAGQTGISASVSASGVLSLSSMTADTAEVVVQAVAGGVTLQSRMNLYKVRPGSSYTENLALRSGEEVSSADYGLKLYAVSGELVPGETYTWTVWGMPGAGRYFRIYPTSWTGLVGNMAEHAPGVYRLTAAWTGGGANARRDAFMVLAAPHDATTVSTIHRIKVERGANTSPVWSPAPSEMTGEDAVIYDLQPSAGVIKRGMTGEPDVREVSCAVYKSVGASRGLTGEKTLRVWRIGEDAAESTIAHAGGQCAPVAVTARTGQVVFSLYDSDTLFDESTLLDRERVPVVSDASDLEVGGTNMLPGTKGWAGWIKHGYALIEGTYNGLGVAHLAYPAGAAVGTAYDLKMAGLVLEPDTVYTLSVWAYGTGRFISYVWPDVGGRTYSVNGVPSEATGGTIEGVNTLTGKWRRYWVVFRTRGGSLTDRSAFFRLERHGSEVWLAGAKLEKGNVPTDWSPAPGDVESEISSFDYLKAALAQNGVVESGLALLSLIKVGEDTNADGYIQNTRAGINGLYDKKLGGRTIATWWGGDIVDRFGPDDRPLSPVPANAASGLVRMDGSGYMADGLIWWRADGSGGVAGSNITWDSDGRVKLGTGITIDVTSSTGIERTLGDVVEFINGITKFLSPAKADGTELKWKDYKEGVQLKARTSLFSAGGVTALGMGPEITGGAGGQSVELLTDWRHDPAGKALGAVLGVELRDIADHADSTAASAELKASNAGVRVTGLQGRLSRLSRRTLQWVRAFRSETVFSARG